MLPHYLKSAFHNLFRHKFSVFVAIAGLSIGLLSAMLLLSYGLYYLDYDRCVTNPDEWYRVRYDTNDAQGQFHRYSTFYEDLVIPLANDIPEIVDFVKIWDYDFEFSKTWNGEIINLGSPPITDPNLFDHYPFQLVYGSADSVHSARHSLFISESKSRELFGDVNPVGFKINRNRETEAFFSVTGVYEDLPENMHLRSDSYWFHRFNEELPNPDSYRTTAYVRIRIPNPDDVEVVRGKLQTFFDENPEYANEGEQPIIHLDPVTKIHFIQGLEEDEPTMNFRLVVAVLALGALFLLSALLNFVNLVVFTWRKREDEFSSRRALGASRGDIFAQLNTEYLLRYALAVVAAFVVYYLLFDSFAAITQLDLARYTLFAPSLLWSVLGVVAALGVLSSLAVSLRFAVRTVRSAEQLHRSKHVGGMAALALQIALSAMFIVTGLHVSAQMRFVRNRDLGYDHANTIEYKYTTVEGMPDHYLRPSTVLDSLRRIDGVTMVTASAPSLVSLALETNQQMFTYYATVQHEGREFPVTITAFLSINGLLQDREVELLLGEYPMGDSWANCVINKTFMDTYFDGGNPVGAVFLYDNGADTLATSQVVGVVKDPWFFPQKQAMPPMIFHNHNNSADYIQITYDPTRKGEVLARLDEAFRYFAKNSSLGYRSQELDTAIRGFYASETTYAHIVTACAVAIALISIMGVFSISSLHIQEQMKDIAIRRICGAALGDVFKVYARGFAIVLGAASVVGLAVGRMLSVALLADFPDPAPGRAGLLVMAFGIVAVIVLTPLYFNVRRAFLVKPFVYLQNQE